MKKIILLLLFLIVGANAADYTIVVNNKDNVEILKIILNGINYFLGLDNSIHEGADRYVSFVKFVIILGTLWILIQLAMSAMAGNASAGFKHYFMYLVMIFAVSIIMYGPKSSVMLQTRDGSAYSINEDVPTFFAFTLSAFTTIRYELSDITETAYNVPDPTDNFISGGSGGLGYNGGQISLSKIATVAVFANNENFKTLPNKYSAYLRDCVILPNAVSGNATLDNYQYEKDLKLAISPAATGFGNEFITYEGHTGKCDEFWTTSGTFGGGFVALETELQSFENNITAGTKIGTLASSLAYFGAITENSNAIANAASVKSAVTQAVLSNEYRNVFTKMGVAGQVSADGAAQSMADMQLSGISTGLFVSEQLPRAGFLLFALMIAATPFLLAFAMFPGSAGILINFLKTLLWISLWEPMGNILGIFQDYHFAKILQENGYTTVNEIVAMTPASIVDISSEAASMAGIAGGMFVAVQGLSWMLITGSGQMIGNLLSSTASNFQRTANADSQMETRSDMQEAALMSDEMGRNVSLREKYAYGSSMRAASNAGNMSGFMKAHGSNPNAAMKSIASTESANTSFAQSTAIGNAAAIGNTYGGNTKSMQNTAEINQTKTLSGDLASASTLSSVSQAQRTGSQNAAQTTRTDIAQSGYLANMTDEQKEAVASKDGSRVEQTKQTIEDISSQTNKPLQQSVASMVDIGATKDAGSHLKTSQNINEQNKDGGYLKNQTTIGGIDGMEESSDATKYRELGDNKNKEITDFGSDQSIGGRKEEMETFKGLNEKYRNQKTGQTQKKEGLTKELNATNSKIKKILSQTPQEAFKARTAALEKYNNSPRSESDKKELQQEMNRITANETAQKTISNLEKSNEELTKAEERWTQAQEDFTTTMNSSPTEEEAEAAKEKLSRESSIINAEHMIHERKVKEESKSEIGQLYAQSQELQQKIENTDGEIAETQRNIDATQIEKTGVKKAFTNLQGVGQVKTGSADANFGDGQLTGAEMKAVQKTLEEKFGPEAAGKAMGTIKGFEVAGKALNATGSGEEILKMFDNANATQQLKNIGVSQEVIDRVRAGVGTENDSNDIVAAAQGLNYLKNSFTMDGNNMSATMDKDGHVGAMTQDGKRTFSDGTSIQYDFSNSAAGASLEAGDSQAKIASLKAAANIVDIGTGLITSKLKNGTKGMGELTPPKFGKTPPPKSHPGNLGMQSGKGNTSPQTSSNYQPAIPTPKTEATPGGYLGLRKIYQKSPTGNR